MLDNQELRYDREGNLKIEWNLEDKPVDLHEHPIINNKEEVEIILNMPDTEMTEESSTVYTTGNIPGPSYTRYDDNMAEKYKSKGKRFIPETLDKKKLIDEGKVLNLTAHDPQLWNIVIDNWKNRVVNEYIRQQFVHTAEEMLLYLETFLGESARKLWEQWKVRYPHKQT